MLLAWPSTIPHDLAMALAESRSSESWWITFLCWAKTHKLQLKLQWMPSLAQGLSELDWQRALTSDADRWGVIQEWLEQHGVETPARLPVAPESPGGKFV